jgi:hypothetical protein
LIIRVIYLCLSSIILLSLLSLIFSKIFSKTENKNLEAEILFHQTIIFNSFIDIIITLLAWATGIFPWIIFNYLVYKYNLNNGEETSAFCLDKFIRSNKNIYFENPKYIVVLRYTFEKRQFIVKTNVSKVIFDEIENEKTLLVKTSHFFPRFWTPIL